MATVIPFPSRKAEPRWGLTNLECAAVDSWAGALLLQGCVTGISVHNDGQFLCVFDCQGKPYSLGREDGICYLFDPDEALLTRSPHFQIVLQALEAALKMAPQQLA